MKKEVKELDEIEEKLKEITWERNFQKRIVAIGFVVSFMISFALPLTPYNRSLLGLRRFRNNFRTLMESGVPYWVSVILCFGVLILVLWAYYAYTKRRLSIKERRLTKIREYLLERDREYEQRKQKRA